MTKKNYYNQKSKFYKDFDPEGNLRYQKAISLTKIEKSDLILDMGCKKSILLDLIPENKNRYYGIDISDQISKPEMSESNFKVVNVDEGIPFEKHFFDTVFCLELLEHVENPTFVLNEINRILKPEGSVILSIPNPYCWFEVAINCLNKMPKGTEGHISSWTKQTFNALAKTCGFEIEKYIGTFCRIPFTSRFNKKRNYLIFSSNALFLSRSLIFKLKKIS